MKVTIEDGTPFIDDKINVSGIYFKDKYTLFADFDHTKPIGRINNLKVEDGKLVADCDIENAEALKYGIGFNVLKSHMEGDIRVLDEIKLHCISVIP